MDLQSRENSSGNEAHTGRPRRLRAAALFLVCLLTAFAVLAAEGSLAQLPSTDGSDAFIYSYGANSSSLPVNVSAKEAVVYCVQTGSFLYDKGGDTRIYPASTTKLLTSIIAIEDGDLDEEITVSDNAVNGISSDSSHIALRVGEVITLRDAVYGMLMASGNDCAVATAEALAGSVEDFADMMNDKAEEIGCTDSHFTNPHGLYNKNHYSTCKDLARIMNYCINNDTFLEIDSALKYDMPKTNKSAARELWNGHRMVKGKYAYYSPVICGKTGYISESGNNLVTYGEKNGIGLIVVVAGCDTPDSCCVDTRALMEYYFNNYELDEVKLSDANLEPIEVGGKEIPVTTEGGSFQVLVPSGIDTSSLDYAVTLLDNLTLPVKKGDAIANVSVTAGDIDVGTLTLEASETVYSTGQKVIKVLQITAITLAAAILLLLLIRNYNKNKRKRRRRRSSSTRRKKAPDLRKG